MKIFIITLFPEMFEGPLQHSMMLKATKNDIASFEVINLRDFGEGERRTVDDTPYGGGDGMLLKPGPVVEAIEAARSRSSNGRVLLMTPRGRTYTQSYASRLANDARDIILVCGRYEGFDERIRAYVDEEVSVGNFVLTGGEIPALVITDSVVRLIPGVLGGETSAEIESFHDDASIEFPQYTRPETFRGQSVPEVLLSGNHGEIEAWRAQEAARVTRLKRESDAHELDA